MPKTTKRRVNKTRRLSLEGLTAHQQKILQSLVDVFHRPLSVWTAHNGIMSLEQAQNFSDMLLCHHTNCDGYLDKTKFEGALEKLFSSAGREVIRPTKRSPFDLYVDGERWALKTQGDKLLEHDKIFISKFMEMGGVRHEVDSQEYLDEVMRRFLQHLVNYERIFILRYKYETTGDYTHHYELVEIPKKLLMRAEQFPLEIVNSKVTPKTAKCTVMYKRLRLFELSFIGGGECKMSLSDIRKDWCRLHATWHF